MFINLVECVNMLTFANYPQKQSTGEGISFRHKQLGIKLFPARNPGKVSLSHYITFHDRAESKRNQNKFLEKTIFQKRLMK